MSDEIKDTLFYQSVRPVLAYECGTTVTTKLSFIEGMITAVSIRFDKVQYEVTYFLRGEQRTVWMNENEFSAAPVRKPIGFKQSSNKTTNQ